MTQNDRYKVNGILMALIKNLNSMYYNNENTDFSKNLQLIDELNKFKEAQAFDYESFAQVESDLKQFSSNEFHNSVELLASIDTLINIKQSLS